MAVQLWLAPAAAGKTAFVLNLVRDKVQGMQAIPRVVVPTQLQVRAWRRRLAAAGGAMGVRVMTFDRLYAECLNAAGEAYTELSEPVQYRLIRSILDQVALEHYQPLIRYPGFIQSLQKLFAELKAARVRPEAFTRATQGLGSQARLTELAQLYDAYQRHLQTQDWADRAGMGWLAVEALEGRAPSVGQGWPLLVVDGFDNFTPIQVALLKTLAARVEEMIITLTGTTDEHEHRPVHRRFDRTRRTLEHELGIQAQPLPGQPVSRAPLLEHLEAGLFRTHSAKGEGGAPVKAGGAVELIETPDRASEVRAALRWLKARLVQDGISITAVALLARDITPYYPFIVQTAAEFELPVRLVDGLPLSSNPAVAALLDLLGLMRPSSDDDPGPALLWRSVIEAWRSPYFDWSAQPDEETIEPIGIVAGDAHLLDLVARWGQVIGGQRQWEEALHKLAERPAADRRDVEEPGYDEEWGITARVPVGPAARALQDKFERFVRRLTPPAGQLTYRAFVQWLEVLIGPDPDPPPSYQPSPAEPTSLQLVTRAGSGPTVERDVAALRAFKDVLRGLVWAEEALESKPAVDYRRFYDELVGAVNTSSYQLPVHPAREELLAADVIQARGLSVGAVAVLGLAEGQFPSTLSEDPFLRNDDRQSMRDEFALLLESSTESAEVEFFYETITRPSGRLLLTRPRLADNGSLWQASPYWEEVVRLTGIEPQTLISEQVPLVTAVASRPELMESLAFHGGSAAIRDWLEQSDPGRRAALDHAAQVMRLRFAADKESALDGNLASLVEFAGEFGPDRPWSASRLEMYRNCPFSFFVSRVLGVEPRPEPTEGLDARQLGNIYHRILEGVYQSPEVSDRTDLQQLLAALPQASAAVLDAAPAQEGFRETAWWEHTRQEIQENVQRSLEALDLLAGEFVPWRFEAVFGIGGEPPLLVQAGNDVFRLRGVIDRIDRTRDGKVRVIDYKTAGPSKYTNPAVKEGKMLQLPLYALAAREVLGLGDPVEGFYWHVRHAEPSPFTLSRFWGGSRAAMDTAREKAWEAVRGARGGHFVPRLPAGGCPSYCPAAAFCWHYHGRSGE